MSKPTAPVFQPQAGAERGARARLVVLVSGGGTNLQAILDACEATGGSSTLAADVVLVISNRASAFALQRAERASVPTLVRPYAGIDRETYDHELAYEATLAMADLVVLAGWDRLLSDSFLSSHRVINLHPAKPGAFPGLDAIARAYRAWSEGRIESGGVMVHYVPDEGIDDGPVIVSEDVPFEPGDTLESFEARVHAVEHRLLVAAIARCLSEPPPP